MGLGGAHNNLLLETHLWLLIINYRLPFVIGIDHFDDHLAGSD